MSPRCRSLGPCGSSPSSRHIGEVPSQHPPDWWKTSGPWAASRRVITSSAAGVAVTGRVMFLEEPHRVLVVADQQTLRLRVVVEHHAMVLTADARVLVAAERGVGWVLVVAVGPHAAGLDRASHPERAAAVPRPHSGAEPVRRVVGDLERLGLVSERRHREHRAEDLLLEDPHLVVALQHSRLVVVAVLELGRDRWATAADQDLGALIAPDLDVALDLLELRHGHLRAHHCRQVERIALLDRADAL